MIKIKKYQIEDYISDATQDALDLKADLVDGKVPASQLPSFVDDVIEVANYAALPIPGATGVIYITLDTNKVYRWTGSVYVEISSGVTNLSYTPGVSNGVVNSDTGSDATIPLAGTVNAGLFSAAEKSKLEGIAPNANVGVIPNAPITGATKTKITYDSKGLVTSGDDATTADISSSTNKRYVTDANLTVINNTSGTNTGDQNLQQVTDLGSTTTNPITVTVVNDDAITGNSQSGVAVQGSSSEGNGIFGTSINGDGAGGYSETGNSGAFYGIDKGIKVTAGNTFVAELNQGLTSKGLVINSGTSSTGNFIELDKNGVDKLTINQEGELTATKLIKDGGTSAQLLAANGDTITAGTNITISGGTISSTGGAGGSSSVNFYLNGSIASNVAGYEQIGATAVIGAGTDFSLVGNGTIAQFLTDVGSPNRLEIPAGAWNFELWLQSSINNSGTNVHIELYKYDGAFTLIATGVSNPISLQTNTTTNLYVTNVGIPQTTLLATDRLAIRAIASNAVGLHSVTLHTEDSNICEVITNFVGGITAINGITQPSQTLATGTSGNDFAINSSGSTHTFNLPSASATARGLVSTTAQTFAGAKTFGQLKTNFTSPETIASIAADGTITGLNTVAYPSFTELAYVKGVTSAIQTQLNYDASATQRGAVTTGAQTFAGAKTFTDNLTALRYLYSGGSIFPEFGQTFYINGTGATHYFGGGTSNVQNNLEVSNGTLKIGLQTASTIASFDANKNVVSLPLATYPSLTELAYVKGVTSGVQTQLNSKANDSSVVHNTGTETISGVKTFNSNPKIPNSIPANTVLSIVLGSPDGTLDIAPTNLYPTAQEMQYVKGVTSNVQTQLNNKIAKNVATTYTTNTISTVTAAEYAAIGTKDANTLYFIV